MRNAETRDRWEKEVEYAKTTQDCQKQWWCEYLTMQAKFCRKDGYDDLADILEACKDRKDASLQKQA